MKKKLWIASLFSLCLFVACGGDDNKIPTGTGGGEEDGGGTDKPAAGEKPRYVWIDAAGNFERYANSIDNIKEDLKRVKETGFTDIVVDVRPTTGDILFKSSVGEPLKRIDIWSNEGYKWMERTATWDYLQTFLNEGRKLGLKVNASINTFVGGYLCPYGLGYEGMLYRDASKKKWATVINATGGQVNTMDLQNCEADWGVKFLSRTNNEVQEYLLSLLSDLAKYKPDGIILDRCRYDDYGLMSDFSPESRTEFELFIGESVENFPADIMKPGTDIPGKWYKRWNAFRAKTIHDFIIKAHDEVKAISPDTRFGTYVGAWYSTYYTSGVNWASPKYDPSVKGTYASWADSDYKNYGYADHLDFIFLGAYAGVNSIYGQGEWTMEGFCKQGRELLKGDVSFCGGPDVGNGSGWEEGGQSARIGDAVKVCIDNSDGFFVFDLCHIQMFDYWDAFKQSFDTYLKTQE